MPVVTINDKSFPKPYGITIQGFPTPTTATEAVKYALQSVNRFFERFVDNEDLPNKGEFSEDTIEYRRQARTILNRIVNEDLSGIELTILPFQEIKQPI